MPTPKLSRALAEKTIAAVNQALRDGHPLRGTAEKGGGAVLIAAKRLGEPKNTIQSRVDRAKAYYALVPDESLCPSAESSGPSPAEEIQELKNKIKALQSALNSAQSEEITRRAIRKHIFELKDAEPDPPQWLIKSKKASNIGVPTLFLSDWHWGEKVAPEQVAFANEFNMEIAHERARRVVGTAIHLLSDHLRDAEYPGIVCALGGDMVTGDIHEELTATNDAPIMPTLVDLFGVLIETVETLADRFGRVFVPCVTGNHGRVTKRIQAKDRNATNFDWLIYMMLAKHFEMKADSRVSFLIPEGSDCHYRIFNHRYLLTHGDQFRGGDGLIGPLGPITRGRHKKASRDASLDRMWDTMMCGHFHTLMQLPHLVVNGALKGLDEYAYQGNFGWERPAQALWITHPQQGITFQMPVYADDPKKHPEAEWVTIPRSTAA